MTKPVTIPIVKGAALPKPAYNGRKTRYPFETMEVGDMFFLPDRTTNSFATYVSLQGRKLNRRFRTRFMHMHRDTPEAAWQECEKDAPGACQGVGVWRVEDAPKTKAVA